MKTSDFDYVLPRKQIAQTPIEPRDSARLLKLNRSTGAITHSHFNQLQQFLRPEDLLVINRTRVLPARLKARKIPDGGKAEILLLEQISSTRWKCMVGGKDLNIGKKLLLKNDSIAEIVEMLPGAQRIVQFESALDDTIDSIGEMPLPPYIGESLQDQDRYQTVFASDLGSAAAPTAGLHFTPQLIASLENYGVGIAEITLHIGIDTFAPVNEERPQEHSIHTEYCELSNEAADLINERKSAGGRIVAVGTTSVRTLESAANRSPNSQALMPFTGKTDLFILPGYEFQIVDAMITNFHLPRSTLIMLVSAFAGLKSIMDSYQIAIEQEYRFYSFGDAMFID